MENEKDLIKQKMEELPPVIKNALESFDWVGAMDKVVKKHGLFMDQIEDLRNICLETMMGQIDQDDFVYEVKNRLLIEKDGAEEITLDLNNIVFLPIAEILKNSDYEDAVEDENTIKNSLENPPSSKPISFVEQKISTPHSIGANSAPIPMPPGEKYSDPYREDF